MVKQPNQRVCFQFGGFKNLVFEFHKARIKRTRGSESWFLSQWTVNRCVCVHVCTLGVHRLSKVVARTCVASTNQLPDSELPAGSCQADLSADILTIWRGSCLLFTPPFSPSPSLFTRILAVMEKLLRAKPRHPVKYWYWESKVL